jgi:hypothetical protein
VHQPRDRVAEVMELAGVGTGDLAHGRRSIANRARRWRDPPVPHRA